MSAVYVDHLVHALGPVRQSVEEAAARGLLRSPPGALSEAGFRLHHVAGDATAYDLARAAVAKIPGGLPDVGAVVYATCLPGNGTLDHAARFAESRDVKDLMDFPLSHLQADFGLDGAQLIGLTQQACTGMLGSLRLARALLAAEPETGRVLCVTADRFPPGALYEQSYNLISDGAAACIVSAAPAGWKLLACHGEANGALARADDDETAGSFFAWSHRVISETLRRAGLAPSDLRWIVAQNMNRRAWEILARLLAVDPERVAAPTLAGVGHVISGDNVINLAALDAAGAVAPGEKALLFMAGYGLHWQCVILEKTGGAS